MAEQKEEIIDLTHREKVTFTDKDPHHNAGDTSHVHPKVAEKLRKKGWIK